MPSATPICTRIVNDIRARVASGELRPGDQLPSIRELGIQYECSSAPVKAALRELSTMGDTIGHQGKGHFIAPPPEEPPPGERPPAEG